jgi:heme-degrading monooxygenase HmoA
MIRRVHAAVQALVEVPGYLDVHCWEAVETEAIVTSGRWESKEARQAGFAAAAQAGVDFDYDDRESRPRDIFHLSPV